MELTKNSLRLAFINLAVFFEKKVPQFTFKKDFRFYSNKSSCAKGVIYVQSSAENKEEVLTALRAATDKQGIITEPGIFPFHENSFVCSLVNIPTAAVSSEIERLVNEEWKQAELLERNRDKFAIELQTLFNNHLIPVSVTVPEMNEEGDNRILVEINCYHPWLADKVSRMLTVMKFSPTQDESIIQVVQPANAEMGNMQTISLKEAPRDVLVQILGSQFMTALGLCFGTSAKKSDCTAIGGSKRKTPLANCEVSDQPIYLILKNEDVVKKVAAGLERVGLGRSWCLQMNGEFRMWIFPAGEGLKWLHTKEDEIMSKVEHSCISREKGVLTAVVDHFKKEICLRTLGKEHFFVYSIQPHKPQEAWKGYCVICFDNNAPQFWSAPIQIQKPIPKQRVVTKKEATIQETIVATTVETKENPLEQTRKELEDFLKQLLKGRIKKLNTASFSKDELVYHALELNSTDDLESVKADLLGVGANISKTKNRLIFFQTLQSFEGAKRPADVVETTTQTIPDAVKEFCQQHNLILVNKEQPITSVTIDLGVMGQQTLPLSSIISAVLNEFTG